MLSKERLIFKREASQNNNSESWLLMWDLRHSSQSSNVWYHIKYHFELMCFFCNCACKSWLKTTDSYEFTWSVQKSEKNPVKCECTEPNSQSLLTLYSVIKPLSSLLFFYHSRAFSFVLYLLYPIEWFKSPRTIKAHGTCILFCDQDYWEGGGGLIKYNNGCQMWHLWY